MRRSSWITAALLLAPAAYAQQATTPERHSGDIPDNQEAFQEKQVGSNTPEEAAAQSSGRAEGRRQAVSPGERLLIGTVVRAEPDRVFVESQGAVVPLTITPYTRVGGAAPGQVSGLQPGQQVRARFDVLGAQNFATELQPNLRSGQGGSGPGQATEPIGDRDLVGGNTLSPSEGESKGPGSPMPIGR
jgi:hypothetical protein